MPTVIIDEQEIELPAGKRLNGIEAARLAGVEIPHYCWHPGLSVVASCRMCLVESGRKDPETGKISMLPKLVPACQTPAGDNTVFVTNSEKVKHARSMVEEDLLIRHPIDCPICDKAGECHLQDYHFEHGHSERRADIKPFTSRRRGLGDTVTLFVDRCVMCSRCVRFTREISGTSELMVVNRGSHEEIDVFPGYPLDNKMSGNVVDLCPVGALGDADFLYSQRVWFMKSHASVCAGCSTGCSINVDENQDRVYRLKPRENEHVNGWWMCDEGRYGFKHIHDPERISQPTARGENGEHENIEWPELIEKLDVTLRKAGRLAVAISPHLTVEEAFLLCSYARDVDPQASLAIGPIPVVGEDESFANGFTIRAEKCPNRRGVEQVVSGFGSTLTCAELLESLSDGDTQVIWLAGGYKTAWIDEAAAATIASSVETIVLQDMFRSPLSDAATFVLPAASFAERSGSYVNFNHRLQSFEWAIRPPAGVWSEGQLLWRLLRKPGLFSSRSVLDDISRDNSYFAAATEAIPPTGIDLRVTQLA